MKGFIERLKQIDQEKQEEELKEREKEREEARLRAKETEIVKQKIAALQNRSNQVFQEAKIKQRLKEITKLVGQRSKVETFTEEGITYPLPNLVSTELTSDEILTYSLLTGIRWNFGEMPHKGFYFEYDYLGIEARVSISGDQLVNSNLSPEEVELREEILIGAVQPWSRARVDSSGWLEVLRRAEEEGEEIWDLVGESIKVNFPSLSRDNEEIKTLSSGEWKDSSLVEKILMDKFASPPCEARYISGQEGDYR